MKKTILIFLLFFISIFSTGCPNGRANMPKVLSDKVIRYAVDSFQTDLDDYKKAIDKNELDKAKLLRNETVFKLKRNIDANYADFENNIYLGKASSNVLFDITELGAAATIGFTNGERVKTIIGTALTAFKGGRKSIDVNFFREKTTESLISTMRAARSKVETKINIGLRNDVVNYTLEEALGDLIDYFFAGSLSNALVELSQQAAATAKDAKSETDQKEKERLRAGFNVTKEIDTIRNKLFVAINNGSDAEKSVARLTLIKVLKTLKEKLTDFQVTFDENGTNQNLFDELQKILKKAALMDEPPLETILEAMKNN